MKNEDLKMGITRDCKRSQATLLFYFQPVYKAMSSSHYRNKIHRHILLCSFREWKENEGALCWFRSLLIIHLEALAQALNAGLMMIQFILTAPLIADLVSFPNTVGE